MFKKILIYRIGNLGDMVCAMPAMSQIRQIFPKAEIFLLAPKESDNPDPQEILGGFLALNGFIDYAASRPFKLKNLINLTTEINKYNPDLIIYLSQPNASIKRIARDWLFFRLVTKANLFGFKKFLPQQNEVYLNEVDRLLRLLEPLGKSKTVNYNLPITLQDNRKVAMIIKSLGLKNNEKLIVVCPGGKFSAKHWPVDNFIQVLKKLSPKNKIKVLILGGADDYEVGQKIIKSLGSGKNIAGQTSFMESAVVLSRASLVLANDCGPVHLAAAVNAPVVAVYSARDRVGLWHPWGKDKKVFRDDTVPCKMCFKTGCDHQTCLKNIKIDDVVKACQVYLQRK